MRRMTRLARLAFGRSSGLAAGLAFAELAVDTEPTSTVLSGELDQAALLGLIDRVRALGLELIDIRRVRDSEQPSS